MPVNLTLRTAVGRRLTNAEVDGNWQEIIRALFGAAADEGAALIKDIESNDYPVNSIGRALKAARVLRRGRPTAPHANFSWFTTDFTVAQCQGPGQARLEQDLYDVFHTKYSALWATAVHYVHPSGNDTNTGTSWAAPFLTLAKALRNTANGTIYVWPGTYDMSDFRRTDTSGTQPKRIIAPFGNVTLRVAGDDISAATWTANGTFGNVWQTTLVTTNKPVRVLLKNVTDRFGELQPLPQYDSLANVNGSVFGWYYDTATQILYVRFRSENVNTTTKTNLQAVYGTSAGDMRTLLYSSTSYWEGITFHGYVSVLKEPGQAVPEFWAKRCTFKYGNQSSMLVEGGRAFHQDCRSHRGSADGGNYTLSDSSTPRAVEINYRTEMQGDVDTFGTAQTMNPQGTAANKNGSSNHSGHVVRINGYHVGAWGPAIADTSTSYSWCLGTEVDTSAITPNSSPTLARYGFVMQANNAWLDSCVARGHDEGFNADASAAVRTFNCFGSQLTTTSGTFTEEIPA